MTQSDQSKENFIYPLATYRGKFSPENLIFNANLQEFGQKVSILCALEANGKISPTRAYEEIKILWDKLEKSTQEILAKKPPPPNDEP